MNSETVLFTDKFSCYLQEMTFYNSINTWKTEISVKEIKMFLPHKKIIPYPLQESSNWWFGGNLYRFIVRITRKLEIQQLSHSVISRIRRQRWRLKFKGKGCNNMLHGQGSSLGDRYGISMKQWGNDNLKNKTKEVARMCTLFPLRPPRISYEVTRDWTRGSAVRMQLLVLCGQNAECFDVNAGGTYRYHYAFKT